MAKDQTQKIKAERPIGFMKDNFLKGFIKENPIFVFLLGMCPALAVTASFETSLGMGILVIFVLTLSNSVVSLLRDLIPNDLRTPAFIVIIATFVTAIGMLTNAYAPELFDALGVFLPLIVVNCLILGRAEAFASKNNVLDSAVDGLGMGLGFTFALVVIGVFREFLATGGIMYGVYLPFFVDSEITLLSFNLIMLLIGGLLALLVIVPLVRPRKSEAKISMIKVVALIVFSSIFIGLSILVPTDFAIADYALSMFSLPPGAFIALGIILAAIQGKKVRKINREVAAKKAKLIELKKAAMARKAAAAKLAKAGE